MVRDTQRSRVYNCDSAFYAITKDNLKHFIQVPDIQAYVNKLISSAWWKRRWKITNIEVRDGRRRRSAAGWYSEYNNKGYITLPKRQRNEEVILHELSHVLTIATYNYDVAMHGREYCRIFLELISHCIGKDAAKLMKEIFKSNNVKWKIKKSRPDLKGKTPPWLKKKEEVASEKTA